jgi:glutathione S-transferase
MLRIHDYKGFPNPTHVRIAIAEKGLQDEIVFVNVPAAEHKTSAFLARNP